LKQVFQEAQWASFVMGRKAKSWGLAIKRLVVVPRLPRNPDGKVLLHLGCGQIASPGFINVDVRPGPHVHHIHEVTDLSIFADDYADLIYACHVLEHVRHAAVRKVLWEWRRVLKPGGILRLSVPDFDKLLVIYESSSHDIHSIMRPLMGGQGYEYNAHRGVFNCVSLTDALREVGFREIRPWDPECVSHHDFRDWANSDHVWNGRTFPVSLNLEAIK